MPAAYQDIKRTGVVSEDDVTNQLEVGDTSHMVVGMPLYFTGSTALESVGGLSNHATYFVQHIVDATHLRVSSTKYGNHLTIAKNNAYLANTVTLHYGAKYFTGTAADINTVRGSYTIPAKVLTHVLTQERRTVGREDVGRKVDPHALMNGRLKVVLRDKSHNVIPVANPLTAAGEMSINDEWQVTLVFVHKR